MITITRFDISPDLFGDRFTSKTLEESFDLYEKKYKKLGFILNKETETVFIDIKEDIRLNEGDRVFLFGEFRMVIWKCTYVSKNMVEYIIESE